jgi:hypothetical protein
MPKIEFNKIPQIKIGSNSKPGRAFGGLIYSSNLDVGVNGDPTRLSLNVVPDDDFKTDEFAIKSENLSDQNRQTITIGNMGKEVDPETGEEIPGAEIKWIPIITMENMILTSYNKTKSVEDKILSLTYVDGSVLLDKVFVGLINRHYQTKKDNEYEYEIMFDALCNSRYSEETNVQKELRGQCDGRGMELISTMLDDNFKKTQNKENPNATEEEKKIIYGTPEDAGKHWAKDEDGNIDLPEWVRDEDTKKVDKNGDPILFTGAKIKRKYLKAGTRVEKITTAEGVFTGEYKTINYQIFVPSELSEKNREVEMVERVKDTWAETLFDGALIILGREEFKESVCDASMDVSYSFTDLLNAIKGLGIEISKAIDKEGKILATDSLFDRNDQYFKSYAGTLREVLQRWCSDLGFGFHWDYSTKIPTIVGTDLTEEGRIDLDEVQKKITENESGAKKDQDQKNYVIESSEENVSLEETYQQVFVSQYLKGSKKRENAHTSITQDYFSNVDFQRLLGVGDETNRGTPVWNPSIIYRSSVEFMISCGLAKYNDSLRDIFNMRLAIAHSQKKTGDLSKFLPLGITGVIPLSWNTAMDFVPVSLGDGGQASLAFIKDTLNIGEIIDFDTLVCEGGTVKPITDFTYFIGTYDDTLRSKFVQLEKMVAEFWGRFYRTGHNYNGNHWECSNSHKREENITYEPNAQWASWYEEHSIDGIRQILQSITNIFPESGPGNTQFVTTFLSQLQEAKRNLADECKKTSKERGETGFYHFSRSDAKWGTQAQDIDGMLTPFAINIDPDGEDVATFTSGRKKTNLTNPYVAKQIDIPGLAKAMILADPNISPALTKMIKSSKGKVSLFIVPGIIAGELVRKTEAHGISGKPSDAIGFKTTYKQINRKIAVEDLGQVVITNSKLGDSSTMNFRNKYPCFSGTDKELTFKTVDCTGAVDDFKAPGYNPGFVTRNLFEELQLMEKLCQRDKEVETRLEAECKTICERTLLQDACGKCAQDEIDFPDRFTKTMLSTKEGYVFCDSFNLKRKNAWKNVAIQGASTSKTYFYSDEEHIGTSTPEQGKSVDEIINRLGEVRVIFPSRNAHGATRTFSSNIASISKGSKLVIGGDKLRKNSTRRLKFLEKNITSDLEQYYEGQASGTEQIVNGVTPWDAGQVRALFLSTDGDPIRAKTLQEYHDLLEENLNLEVLDPQRSISFKLVTGKSLPSAVSSLLNIRNGLDSLSYSLGADGFSLDLNFNNKPPALKDLEVGMRDIGPMVSLASMR